MKKLIGLIIIFLLFGAKLVFSQSAAMQVKSYNFESFTESQKLISKELDELSDFTEKAHPEYGFLPFNAGCSDCFEILSKREVDSRYFIKNGSNGSSFYIQKAMQPLHYEEDGVFKTLDYRIKPKQGVTNVFESRNQPIPTEIDLNKNQSTIDIGFFQFEYNSNVSLLWQNQSTTIKANSPNTSSFSAGDDGVINYNFWNGIDRTQIAIKSGFKTNYIINNKSSVPINDGWMIISEIIELPQGYKIVKSKEGGVMSDEGLWFGELLVTDNSNNEYIKLGVPTIQNGDTVSLSDLPNMLAYPNIYSGYKVISLQNNRYEIQIYVSAKILNHPNITYPVTIDPPVTGTNSTTGSFCTIYGVSAGSCSVSNATSLVVTVPGGSTLTGATFGMSYTASNGGCPCASPPPGLANCLMRDALSDLTTVCGRNPTNPSFYWYCNTAAAGTCSGSGLAVNNLVTCIAPQCANYNITFNLNKYRCYCSCSAACGTSCINFTNFSVTVSASTLETLGNTTTGNGTYNYTGTCSGTQVLNPNASNGVPGYTYSWSPGGQTTPTITVNNWPNATYTCTVTDACGNSRTATFNINCPLSVELLSFGAIYNGNNVELKWKTASEINNSHFIIERSIDGKVFKPIATLDGKGTSNVTNEYKHIDPEDLSGGYYYRLKQVDYDGEYEYSEVKYVYVSGSNDAMLVYPNPAENMVTLEFNSYQGKAKTVTFVNTLGQVLMEQQASVVDGQNKLEVDISSLPKGNYFVLLKEDVILYKSRLVIAR